MNSSSLFPRRSNFTSSPRARQTAHAIVLYPLRKAERKWYLSRSILTKNDIKSGTRIKHDIPIRHEVVHFHSDNATEWTTDSSIYLPSWNSLGEFIFDEKWKTARFSQSAARSIQAFIHPKMVLNRLFNHRKYLISASPFFLEDVIELYDLVNKIL